jgi:hypothetical protein
VKAPSPLVFALFLAAVPAASAEFGLLPDRRRDQFPHEPGYAVVPFAYNLPGIGAGYGILAAVTNVNRSCTDIVAGAFFGDAVGQAVAVDAIHLVPRTLVLDLGGVHISKTTILSYAKRGMDTAKNDYSVAEFDDFLFGGSRLTATHFERRAEAYVAYYAGRTRLEGLRDRDGSAIVSARGAPDIHFETVVLGGRLDATDDYIDPRRGLRFEPSLWRSPPRGSGPDYYMADYSLTAYVPLGRRNTWAFNFLRSDAHVLREGLTDPAALEREQGFDCASIADPARRADCRDYVATLAAQNARGMATSLGGLRRLRSYSEGRYKGAHAEFFGTELRWNLTDEFRPFDIYVMKDIRTAAQLAFFYEAGSVADSRGELWRIVRQSYGAGARIITASGLVYRFDLAHGDEGLQPSVFFQYPWEL